MSPIDQPLMVLELLGRSSPAPADPGQRMVGKVLTGNGSTAYGNGAYSLIGGDELSHYVTRCCSYIASGRITCSS